MSNNIIELENVVKNYRLGKTEVKALRGLTMKVEKGDFIAIMGPSGCGKSTLLNMIGCLDKPTQGKVLFEGRDIRTRPCAGRRTSPGRDANRPDRGEGV